MTIEEISPYLEVIAGILQAQSDQIQQISAQLLEMEQVLALLIFFVGFLGGLLFMRVFWERFK